ncbi:hypothetical protein NKJ71_19720 [Mesorhizobium sp. M0050]|uniref:hypothetical protein n=1 Tax=Mesorhizobium sp. M0050 TaxID=2956861 RepID=UPI00333641C8
MTVAHNKKFGFFAPPTMASAMQGIANWDRRAGSLPLLSACLLGMKDGPQTWSSTHSWPSVRSAMVSLGLARELEPLREGGWITPRTQITDLGIEVRAAIAAQVQS